jgi:hypothetical protein
MLKQLSYILILNKIEQKVKLKGFFYVNIIIFLNYIFIFTFFPN